MKFPEHERRSNSDRRKELRRYVDGRVNDRRKNAADPFTQYEELVHIFIDRQEETKLLVRISDTTGIEIANEIIPDTCQALSRLLDRYKISMLPHNIRERNSK